MSEYCEPKNEQRILVQLNIVTVVDVDKAIATGTLDGALYMMDNGLGRDGQGTAHLQTACKQGQIINWIIYPMDSEMRSDGTWPPFVKINNIVFLGNQEGGQNNVSQSKVCTDFKIYGMPDMMRSPLTPVYYYWAGMVQSIVEPGVYPYRLVIEIDQGPAKAKIYLNTVEKPALKVLCST